MKNCQKLLALTGLGVFSIGTAFATPSTNIWNPTTDIQALNIVHLGIDNYYSIKDNKNNAYAFPTDVGLTYGAAKGLEVGFDAMEPTSDPLIFNAKYGLPETKNGPAYAVGLQGFGTTKATESNMIYGLVSKTFGQNGRITLGGYTGKKSVLVDENGNAKNSGVIAAWDKTFTSRWWGSVDYASGQSSYGAFSFGASYKFTPTVGVLFGYVVFNNDKINPNDTFTTQLDIDF